MDEVVLSVKKLDVYYGNNKVIKNLSFDVKKKERLVIMGPNGAGKTTLFRALIGAIPYNGEIKWSDDVKIGYLPSQETIFRDKLLPITVKDFFMLKNIKPKQAIEALEEVDFDKEYIKKSLFELSTGQFQRMSVAWMLSDNPSVVLFDEPFSGVDITGRKTIYDLLHKFWEKRNLTILMISHDLSVVWEHASYVLCLGAIDGKCYGAPQSVLSGENLKKIYGKGIKFYEHKHN